MITRVQTFKLIAFVLSSAALALGLLVLFTGRRWFESTDTYYLRVPSSVDGIQDGSAVAVRGVRVGSVAAIELYADDFESVRLKLAIKRGLPIPKQATATLAYAGLTGLKFVEIAGGDGRVGVLKPGSYIPYQESLLDRLSDRADDLVSQASQLLQTTNALVARVSAVAQHVDPDRIDAILAATEQTAQNFAAAGAQARRLVEHTGQPLQQTLGSADAAFRAAQQLTDRAGTVMKTVNATVVELKDIVRESESQIRAIGYNLRDATQSFKELGRELRQRPSRLLISGAPEERRLP